MFIFVTIYFLFIIWTFIIFLIQCDRKKKKNNKCPNNEKEIYNDKYKHTRQIIRSTTNQSTERFRSHQVLVLNAYDRYKNIVRKSIFYVKNINYNKKPSSAHFVKI